MDFDQLFEEPSRRRWWLLTKALECNPLDQALDLARAADRFVLNDPHADVVRDKPAAVSAELSEASAVLDDDGQTDVIAAVSDALERTSQLPLSPHRRAELFDRLERGAKNAELAIEFGITPKQVQGLRMAMARKGKRLQDQGAVLTQNQDATISGRVEDVVRYLRQQGDVVVGDGGGFLVNARFHLGRLDLVARANRMRQRQDKPLFKIDVVEPHDGAVG